MASTKRGVMIASTLLLVAIFASACDMAYSQPPAVTNTPIDQNSLFATALGESTSESNAQVFASQTALAAGTLGPATNTPAGITPQPNQTETSTPLVELNPTNTPTATLAVSNVVPTSTSAPSGAKPSTYVLRSGEFPYCIARRFNVDPEQLLSINGLSSAQANSLSAGTTLTIPQGGAFPGDRSWHDHPATFTVGSTYDTNTVYGVACYYGDIEPSVIAQNNGISVDAALTVGQTLNIP